MVEKTNPITCVFADNRRARTRRRAPSAGATRDVVAIDNPIPIEVEKNRIELA